ncbi:MAG: 4Fe-4S dicluster domain-containing protein [Betaproteobacteria bacterium]|nr:4Fe-4S dicluster domain-containing protein [Betaproteobacteria bacterium]
MAGKSFFIDTTKCTACRACQVACKQWNQNPATKTVQSGTYQNPPDLSDATFKVVRFAEEEGVAGDQNWYFFPDQCRHCIYPLCKFKADQKVPGAVTLNSETRAIVFNPKVKMSRADFEEIREACPYDIPRYDEKTGGMSKCTMCLDRVENGMQPACVQACPTGTMNFGDRQPMLDMAHAREKEVKQVHPKANLANSHFVRVIFLLKDDPKKYHQFAATDRFTPKRRKP